MQCTSTSNLTVTIFSKSILLNLIHRSQENPHVSLVHAAQFILPHPASSSLLIHHISKKYFEHPESSVWTCYFHIAVGLILDSDNETDYGHIKLLLQKD